MVLHTGLQGWVVMFLFTKAVRATDLAEGYSNYKTF